MDQAAQYQQLYITAFNTLTEILELIEQKQLELEEKYIAIGEDNCSSR